MESKADKLPRLTPRQKEKARFLNELSTYMRLHILILVNIILQLFSFHNVNFFSRYLVCRINLRQQLKISQKSATPIYLPAKHFPFKSIFSPHSCQVLGVAKQKALTYSARA